jgi:hypothetical protein
MTSAISAVSVQCVEAADGFGLLAAGRRLLAAGEKARFVLPGLRQEELLLTIAPSPIRHSPSAIPHSPFAISHSPFPFTLPAR